MAYIGNQASTAFTSMAKQDITGDGGQNYTLAHAVTNAQEIEVFVNNVRQEPGVAYTVSGTALAMTGNVASTDDFYVVFQGKAVQTATHPSDRALTATDGTFTGDVDIDGTTTVDGLTSDGDINVSVSNFIHLLDSSSTKSMTLRNWSSSTNSAAIEVDPDQSGSSSYLRIGVDGSEVARFLGGGGLDLSAGNLVLDNGYGIDFSATANSSGTVTHEIFDDYEIGSYTPTIDSGVSGVSYSAQVGRYTKVGRVVYFLQHIDVASHSSRTSGQFQLGGLPFTALNVSNVWGSAWWVYTGGGYNLDSTHITWAIQGGTTRIIAYKNSGATFVGSNISDANAGFHLAGFYFV